MVNHKPPGDHSRKENGQRGENDFPGIHQSVSVLVSASAAAKTVFSKSCDKSEPGAPPSADSHDQAPSTIMIAMHGAAARHSARAQNAHASTSGNDLIRAMIRFSKASGTLSRGRSARAAASNLRSSSSRFIMPSLDLTFAGALRLQILAFRHLG